MVAIRRVRVVWQGLAGGAGVSTFYSAFGDDVVTDLATFFGAITSRFPSGQAWSCAGAGDVIEDSTGEITGGWTGATAWTDTGSAGAVVYAAGVGAFVRWGTSTVVGGRRLKGRTFLTSLETVNYDSAGTLVTSCFNNFNTAAGVLAATDKLLIWHRPTPGGSDGESGAVTSGTVPDKVSWLQTRRD